MSNSIKHRERRTVGVKQKLYENRMHRNALRVKYREMVTEPKEKKWKNLKERKRKIKKLN